ncbi:hypothetical protein COJ01_17215 [Priestia megaterium]|uniref:hypothetical protein n=1 Tax=Priestia megaterium TaxID=1404 RepID=UPI000BF2620C|nr:hypothetical protein [Priestia megaterium]PFK99811.1 hypothetical protein COJ01_17215 [Priestia megaterium]
MSNVVVHVSGGVAEAVSLPKNVGIYILDFDNFRDSEDMGSEVLGDFCPSCKAHSTEFEWNAATMLTNGEDAPRIQNTKRDLFAVATEHTYVCPRCFEEIPLNKLIEEKGNN